MSQRNAISARTRFELLKRDGFKCRYCGISASVVPIHIDHVVPVSAGGSDATDNLVTSCADCNLGKSDVPLQAIAPRPRAEDLAQIREQVRLYSQHAAEIVAYMVAITDEAETYWDCMIGTRMPGVVRASIGRIVDEIGFDPIMIAIESVAKKELFRSENEAKYFFGVIRKIRTTGSGL